MYARFNWSVKRKGYTGLLVIVKVGNVLRTLQIDNVTRVQTCIFANCTIR